MTPPPAAIGALTGALVIVAMAPRPGWGRAGRAATMARPRPGPRRWPRGSVDLRRAGAVVTGPLRRPSATAVASIAGAVLTAALLVPLLAPVPLVVPIIRAHLLDRRQRRAAVAEVANGLPDVVDLLLLCVGAGLSLPLAHPLVADLAPPPLGPALQAAETATVGGQLRADALLGALAPLGDRAAALGHVLVDHLRYGVPLVPGLERIGLELRLDRRRRAEEEARRVPLRLLAPLITCVLPAFGLLTVVPLLVASLRSLPR